MLIPLEPCLAGRLKYYLETGAAKSIYSEARNNTYSDAAASGVGSNPYGPRGGTERGGGGNAIATADRHRAASMDRSTYDTAREDGGAGMLGAGARRRTGQGIRKIPDTR